MIHTFNAMLSIARLEAGLDKTESEYVHMRDGPYWKRSQSLIMLVGYYFIKSLDSPSFFPSVSVIFDAQVTSQQLLKAQIIG